MLISNIRSVIFLSYRKKKKKKKITRYYRIWYLFFIIVVLKDNYNRLLAYILTKYLILMVPAILNSMKQIYNVHGFSKVYLAYLL
jgi:hypothetical protein